MEKPKLALVFEKEDHATEAVLRLPPEEINSFFKIQKIYQKIKS
jgi:hypothetical protein